MHISKNSQIGIGVLRKSSAIPNRCLANRCELRKDKKTTLFQNILVTRQLTGEGSAKSGVWKLSIEVPKIGISRSLAKVQGLTEFLRGRRISGAPPPTRRRHMEEIHANNMGRFLVFGNRRFGGISGKLTDLSIIGYMRKVNGEKPAYALKMKRSYLEVLAATRRQKWSAPRKVCAEIK